MPAVAACTILAARFMWWASQRSTMWAMTAGVLLAFLSVVGALVIAWMMTEAAFRS
jgi:hypothetical protein